MQSLSTIYLIFLFFLRIWPIYHAFAFSLPPDTIEEAKQLVKDLQLNERDGDSFVASAVEIVRNYIDKETKENIEKVLLLSATAAGQAK